MLPYSYLKKIVLGILILHVIIAFWVKLVVGVNNLYPFFSWEFFSYVPNPDYTYSMEVYMVDDTYFDPPLPFSETRYLAEQVGLDSTVYYFLARDLGKALEHGTSVEAADLASQLETLFGDQSYLYSIVKVYHDPVDYWQRGVYEDKEIINVYKRS